MRLVSWILSIWGGVEMFFGFINLFSERAPTVGLGELILGGILLWVGYEIRELRAKEDKLEAREDELKEKSNNSHPIPEMNVFLTLFLYFITLGLYEPIWYLRRVKYIQKLNIPDLVHIVRESSIGLLVINIIGIGRTLGVETPVSEPNGLGVVLWFSMIILPIVLAFKFREAILEHLRSIGESEFPFSRFLTFLFRFFYLQFKINRLPNMVFGQEKIKDIKEEKTKVFRTDIKYSEEEINEIKEKLKESDRFDIKLLRYRSFPDEGLIYSSKLSAKVLQKLGFLESEAKEIINNLPFTLKKNVSREEIPDLYKKLKGRFEVEVIPITSTKMESH
ncbi:MAG: hypothetical protein U9N06_02175 [candidate division WOR-3 bacterium]|nr:hypothetical protein [candidate division WOR-3 bacterium]